VLTCSVLEEHATGSGGTREEHSATFVPEKGASDLIVAMWGELEGGQGRELNVAGERFEGGWTWKRDFGRRMQWCKGYMVD
jgi:hypothetical protein